MSGRREEGEGEMCLFGSKVLIVADSIGLVKPVKFFCVFCLLFCSLSEEVLRDRLRETVKCVVEEFLQPEKNGLKLKPQ